MKKLMFLSLLAVACPLFAERRVDVFFDFEGVKTTGDPKSFGPGARFIPDFDTGGGLGGGVNWFLSDRVSVETKVAGMAAEMHLRVVTSDSVQNVNLGHVQMYPISAMLQWHMAERRMFRPYLGAGAVHTILRNIDKPLPGASGVRFKDPTGLVVGGGLEISLGRKWAIFGDARYIPMETESRATFTGTQSFTTFNTRPLILSTGLSYSLRR